MKNIHELLNVSYDIEICGITDDSRLVKEGYLFVATKGYHVDHFDFIQDAIDKGCVFLIVDREIDFDFPHVVMNHLDELYDELCVKFFDIDLEKFRFLGVTGTDGKTTTATIAKELLDCAYIGTNGLMVQDEIYPTSNTTPCVFEFYSLLKILQERECFTVVMEVSSEALLHGRVDHILFDGIAFTNITGDHINVHGSFENYVQSKFHLLKLLKNDGFVIINGDDSLLKMISNAVTFGVQLDNCYVIQKVVFEDDYTFISLKYRDSTYCLKSPYFGEYNVYNVVQAFLIAKYFGMSESDIVSKTPSLKPVMGRGEILNFGQDFTIVLDYAHTIHGVRCILDAFSHYKEVITVTGCAGGRDASKRSIIGNLVMDKSDISIFTMDDPRFESVDDIIDEMVQNRDDYIRIVDRKKAIYYALDIASSDSVILILGKGRDCYMAIGDQKEPYSDYDVIQEYFLSHRNDN